MCSCICQTESYSTDFPDIKAFRAVLSWAPVSLGLQFADDLAIIQLLVQRLEPEDRVDCQNPWIEPRMGDNTNTESLSYGARSSERHQSQAHSCGSLRSGSPPPVKPNESLSLTSEYPCAPWAGDKQGEVLFLPLPSYIALNKSEESQRTDQSHHQL